MGSITLNVGTRIIRKWTRVFLPLTATSEYHQLYKLNSTRNLKKKKKNQNLVEKKASTIKCIVEMNSNNGRITAN